MKLHQPICNLCLLPLVVKQGCFPFRRAVSLIRSILQSFSWCCSYRDWDGKHRDLSRHYGMSRWCIRWGNTWRAFISCKLGRTLGEEGKEWRWMRISEPGWTDKRNTHQTILFIFFEISFLCINPEIKFKTCNSGWKVDTAAYCSLAPLFKFHALEATWDTFSWEIPLKKTSGETVCLSLVHSTWLHYKACASNRNLCIIVRPLGRLLAAQLCDLLPNCTHKWVEEQERNYGVQATLGCMLPAGEGYPEQSQ